MQRSNIERLQDASLDLQTRSETSISYNHFLYAEINKQYYHLLTIID